jgi:integrase
VVLTDEAAAFFRECTAGRSRHELMFRHDDGGAWQKSEQARPMAEACTNSQIKPAISFHILRHTWASLTVTNGTPLLVVAKNLGHTDTRMVEKHYGHLAPSFIADAIRAGAPRYRVKDDKRKVVPLRWPIYALLPLEGLEGFKQAPCAVGGVGPPRSAFFW